MFPYLCPDVSVFRACFHGLYLWVFRLDFGFWVLYFGIILDFWIYFLDCRSWINLFTFCCSLPTASAYLVPLYTCIWVLTPELCALVIIVTSISNCLNFKLGWGPFFSHILKAQTLLLLEYFSIVVLPPPLCVRWSCQNVHRHTVVWWQVADESVVLLVASMSHLRWDYSFTLSTLRLQMSFSILRTPEAINS